MFFHVIKIVQYFNDNEENFYALLQEGILFIFFENALKNWNKL